MGRRKSRGDKIAGGKDSVGKLSGERRYIVIDCCKPYLSHLEVGSLGHQEKGNAGKNNYKLREEGIPENLLEFLLEQKFYHFIPAFS